jgi:hypothetical protein
VIKATPVHADLRKRDDGKWVCELTMHEEVTYHVDDDPVGALRKAIEHVEERGPIVGAALVQPVSL